MILVMVRFVWKLIHTRRLLVRNFAHHCGGYVLLWLLRVWPVSQSQLVWVSKKLWVSLLQNSSKVNKKTNDPHQIISCFRKRKLRPDRVEKEREGGRPGNNYGDLLVSFPREMEARNKRSTMMPSIHTVLQLVSTSRACHHPFEVWIFMCLPINRQLSNCILCIINYSNQDKRFPASVNV